MVQNSFEFSQQFYGADVVYLDIFEFDRIAVCFQPQAWIPRHEGYWSRSVRDWTLRCTRASKTAASLCPAATLCRSPYWARRTAMAAQDRHDPQPEHGKGPPDGKG